MLHTHDHTIAGGMDHGMDEVKVHHIHDVGPYCDHEHDHDHEFEVHSTESSIFLARKVVEDAYITTRLCYCVGEPVHGEVLESEGCKHGEGCPPHDAD